jgi:hypothetical protein
MRLPRDTPLPSARDRDASRAARRRIGRATRESRRRRRDSGAWTREIPQSGPPAAGAATAAVNSGSAPPIGVGARSGADADRPGCSRVPERARP